MSEMKSWAEREIDLAIQYEEENCEGNNSMYGIRCYESALKAFNSLLEDGHSGFSVQITRHILDRLISGKPLTPIEDTDDMWNHIHDREDGTKEYQCRRMASLFKYAHPDGTVSYRDLDRFYGVHNDDDMATYHNGLIDHIMEELYPITMPYMPFDTLGLLYCITPENGLIDHIMEELYPITMPYMPFDEGIKVVTESFLVDPKAGDYDTLGLLYCITPEGEKREINRYFKEGDGSYGMKEIDVEEYAIRKHMANKGKE